MSQQQAAADLLACPPEVLELAVACIPERSRQHLRTVCSAFTRAVDAVACRLCLSADTLEAIRQRSLRTLHDSPHTDHTCNHTTSSLTYLDPTNNLPDHLIRYLTTRMPHLTAIKIAQGCITPTQLAQAATLPARITSLQLSGALSTADLPPLASAFTSLQQLHLTVPSHHTTNTLAPLATLGSLTSLSLRPTPASSHTPATIPASAFLPLPSLHHLTLHDVALAPHQPDATPFAALAAALPSLHSLAFFPHPTTPSRALDLTPLAQLTALQANITHSDVLLSILISLTHLRSWVVDFCTPGRHHGYNPQLDCLPLINAAAVNGLHVLPLLSHLTLPPELLPIHLTTLTSLTINPATALHPCTPCAALAGHAVPLLRALSRSACLPTLRSLCLLTTSNDPEATVCALFARLACVTHLQLAHNDWSPAMLESLAACTTLRRLLLSGNTRTPDTDTLLQDLQHLPVVLPHLEARHWCIAASAGIRGAVASSQDASCSLQASCGAALAGGPAPHPDGLKLVPGTGIAGTQSGQRSSMCGCELPSRSDQDDLVQVAQGTGGKVLSGSVCRGSASLLLEMEGALGAGVELPDAELVHLYSDEDFSCMWDEPVNDTYFSGEFGDW